MKLQISNKVSEGFTKPKLEEGFYPAKLMGYKLSKKDGTPITGQYGNQMILEFAIFQPDEFGVPAKPAVMQEDNKTTEVIIGKFIYYQYKNQKTGELTSAITPNGEIKKVFEALGWVFDFAKEVDVDLDSLIGNFAKVLLEDYESKNAEGKAEMVSSIKTIKALDPKIIAKIPEHLKGKNQSAPEAVPKVTETKLEKTTPVAGKLTREEFEKRKAGLKTLLDDGMLTQEGYDKTIEGLEAQL